MRPVLLTVPVIAVAVLFSAAACGADQAAKPAGTLQQSASAAGGSGGGSGTSTADAGTGTAGGTGAGSGTSGSAGSGKSGGTGSGSSGGSGSGKSGGAGSGASGSGSKSSVAVCRTGDLSAVVTFQPDDNGSTHRGLVTLTNKTKNTCAVDGWAAISLVNAADEVVPVKTTRVNQPGKPVKTTLKPGTTAWAGIKWTACDKGDSSCGAGNTLRFNLEASTDGDVAELEGFPNPEASDITMKSLQIGSLQPIRQGAVAW